MSEKLGFLPKVTKPVREKTTPHSSGFCPIYSAPHSGVPAPALKTSCPALRGCSNTPITSQSSEAVPGPSLLHTITKTSCHLEPPRMVPRYRSALKSQLSPPSASRVDPENPQPSLVSWSFQPGKLLIHLHGILVRERSLSCR